MEENFSGANNAGRPLLLEGGLDWKALSLSPKDMDFSESKAGAAREIALAFGAPPLLLGLPGDNTFSNYSEANRAFWRQTVLPLVTRVQKSFQGWLQPGFAPFRLDYNADRLEALAAERASEWERVGKAPFLTLDEQREAVGYGPAPKGAALNLRYSPSQPRVPAGSPEGGQWTSSGGGGRSSDSGSGVGVIGDIRPLETTRVAQYRPGGRNRGVGTEPGSASPSQLDRLEATYGLAREAEARVREIDPNWRPEPSLYDPNDIEGRITRNEDLARQANARYGEYLREKYPEISVPRDRQPGMLTGPLARVLERDDFETRRGRSGQNEQHISCF